MHPAYSIVFFTSLTGIGYGLASVAGLGMLPDLAAGPAYGIAFGLIIIGLLCSTAHLGHPVRAWRAFSQWRSSWLSREGVASIVTFIPLLFAGYAIAEWNVQSRPAGLAVAALSLITVFCTSMIYASLRPVAQWRTALTPMVFIGFAAAGGLLAASAIAAAMGVLSRDLALLTLEILAIAWLLKAVWWFRADRVKSRSTPQSATGLGKYTAVSLLERPHLTDNYLTREMGYRVARNHARKLRTLSVLFAAIVPAVGLLVFMIWPDLSVSAFGLLIGFGFHLLGLLIERWLFFAQAKHSVTLYYGAATA